MRRQLIIMQRTIAPATTGYLDRYNPFASSANGIDRSAPLRFQVTTRPSLNSIFSTTHEFALRIVPSASNMKKTRDIEVLHISPNRTPVLAGLAIDVSLSEGTFAFDYLHVIDYNSIRDLLKERPSIIDRPWDYMENANIPDQYYPNDLRFLLSWINRWTDFGLKDTDQSKASKPVKLQRLAEGVENGLNYRTCNVMNALGEFLTSVCPVGTVWDKRICHEITATRLRRGVLWGRTGLARLLYEFGLVKDNNTAKDLVSHNIYSDVLPLIRLVKSYTPLQRIAWSEPQRLGPYIFRGFEAEGI